jgi:hypothetical protein
LFGDTALWVRLKEAAYAAKKTVYALKKGFLPVICQYTEKHEKGVIFSKNIFFFEADAQKSV